MLSGKSHIVTVLCALVFVTTLHAKGGAYGSFTPYSIFGVGDMTSPGTAYNYGMAGVGIAGRNNGVINILNPAAVTARDTLSFMIDFSGYGQNTIFSQEVDGNTLKSAGNVYGIKDVVLSFPIWKSSAMMVGITPLSNTGYKYLGVETSPIIGETGNINYNNTGQGSLNQLFVSAGATFWKRLSVGAEFIYFFGDFEHSLSQDFSKKEMVGVAKYNNFEVNGFSGRFGLQYEQPLGKKSKIILGTTYRMSSKLGGNLETIVTNLDTLAYNLDSFEDAEAVRVASEKGVGLCYKFGNKLSVEFDYSRSNWTETNIQVSCPNSGFAPSVAQSFRFGMEYVPNRSDVRYYFKRVSYRLGAYYRSEYYTYNGMPVNAVGITLGASLPVYRWHNAISLGLEFGQRGTLENSLIRERYINFAVGINIFDIWFQKPKYE